MKKAIIVVLGICCLAVSSINSLNAEEVRPYLMTWSPAEDIL